MRFFENCSDSECVDMFLSENDKDAFGEIFRRYFEDTYRFVYSRVGNKAWTEEIASNTFYTLIQAVKSYDKKARLKTFIFGIAVNKIKQFWYKKYLLRELKLNEDFIILNKEVMEDEPEEHKLLKTVPMILKKLPEKYRLVLTERFLHEKNVRETALSLGLSEENVRVIQSRALKKATVIGEKLL
jgi:RNA polymerase sigma-70 factor, ECF subfamily